MLCPIKNSDIVCFLFPIIVFERKSANVSYLGNKGDFPMFVLVLLSIRSVLVLKTLHCGWLLTKPSIVAMKFGSIMSSSHSSTKKSPLA